MTKSLLSYFLVGSIFLFASCKKSPEKKSDPSDQKIEELISKMTIEEKVGQMTQITLDVVCKGNNFDMNKKQEIDPQKLDTAILKYKVGSILNTGMYSMPNEQWRELIGAIQDVATKKSNPCTLRSRCHTWSYLY
ncbi:MAG: hypothetical protein K2X86_00805 [Cytophagaceae bacterium]|nr:hypothetical protein [Cytophagaceae bacterium]